MSYKAEASIVCAECDTTFNTKIFNVIDGSILDLKTAFMQDQLNKIPCPECEAENFIITPVFYFDGRREAAIAYIPADLQLEGDQLAEELNDLKAAAKMLHEDEAATAYLGSPQICENFDDLIAAILNADGVSEEILKERSRKVEIIDKLMRATGVDDFEERVKQLDSELDETFFEVLTSNIDVVQMQADEVTAETMLSFRRQVARFSSRGKAIVEKIEADRGNLFIIDRSDLLDRLLEAISLKERRKIVSAGYRYIDERLFNTLAARINEAKSNEDDVMVGRLQEVRSDVLKLKHQHEKESQAQLESAEKLFKSVLKAKRPEKVLERKHNQVNESFFFVLGTNIAKARSQGEEETAKALETLGQMAVTIKQANQ